jgi:hypothetical protein
LNIVSGRYSRKWNFLRTRGDTPEVEFHDLENTKLIQTAGGDSRYSD